MGLMDNIRGLFSGSRNNQPTQPLDELQRLNASLESRLSELSRQNQRRNPRAEELEASKWTGQKPQNMGDYDFDRFQRSGDGAR